MSLFDNYKYWVMMTILFLILGLLAFGCEKKEPMPTKKELEAVAAEMKGIKEKVNNWDSKLELYNLAIANKDKTIEQQEKEINCLVEEIYRNDITNWIVEYYRKQGLRKSIKLVKECVNDCFVYQYLWEDGHSIDYKAKLGLAKIRKECDFEVKTKTKEPCANRKCKRKGEYGKGDKCVYCGITFTYSFGAMQINSACRKDLTIQLKKILGFDGDDIYNLKWNIAAGYLHITNRAKYGERFNNYDDDILWELNQIKRKELK